MQVGELFTAQQQLQQAPANGTDSTSCGSISSSLLQQVLQEDESDVSELFFGSAEGPAGGSSSPEAVAWKQRNQEFSQQLAPLPQDKVSTQAGNTKVVD